MKHEEVKGSSNIKSIAYDPGSKTMEVVFNNGGHYSYSGVEQEKFDAFQKVARTEGESTGKHFHANFVKGAPHDHTKHS